MAPTGNVAKPKFYLISSILPDNTKTGGEIVLYRHFVQRHDFELEIVNVPRKVIFPFAALERSRFRTYVRAFMGWYESFDLSVIKSLPKPAFVLTVAHGRDCFAAAKAARYWNVPLVTIFHDWYPASSGVHHAFQSFPDREFRKLYQQSALALCVSQEMKDMLGSHRNAVVFPPIPSDAKTEPITEQAKSTPNILYSGFCGGAYHHMLREVMDISNKLNVRVTITGMESSNLGAPPSNVDVRGFLSEAEFARVFASADILLVLLNFDERNRRHFSTHFPSKLIEYCGKGKLIGVLGPSYATSIRWARQTEAAVYSINNDVTAFMKELTGVYQNVDLRNRYITNALQIYNKEYRPDIVQEKLVKLVGEVLNEKAILPS